MLQSLLKNLRKVIITYFYLLPSSVQDVLHLLLQFILLKITVSYSFLETDLNLVFFWVFYYFHQLILSFIRVSTFKDSNLGCLSFLTLSLSENRFFLLLSWLWCSTPPPRPVLFSFLNSSFKCLPHYMYLLHYIWSLNS